MFWEWHGFNCPKHPKLLLHPYFSFVPVTVLAITPGHVWYLLSGASPCWARAEFPCLDKVNEWLCGLGKCPMSSEGFGMATEPWGEQHKDHGIPGTAAVWRRPPCCCLTHQGGSKGWKKQLSQSLINNQNLPGLGNEVHSLYILFSFLFFSFFCFKIPMLCLIRTRLSMLNSQMAENETLYVYARLILRQYSIPQTTIGFTIPTVLTSS